MTTGLLERLQRDAALETQEKLGDIGMISTIIENHDEPEA